MLVCSDLRKVCPHTLEDLESFNVERLRWSPTVHPWFPFVELDVHWHSTPWIRTHKSTSIFNLSVSFCSNDWPLYLPSFATLWLSQSINIQVVCFTIPRLRQIFKPSFKVQDRTFLFCRGKEFGAQHWLTGVIYTVVCLSSFQCVIFCLCTNSISVAYASFVP